MGSAGLNGGLICYDGSEVFNMKNIILLPGSARANIVLKAASLWSATLVEWSQSKWSVASFFFCLCSEKRFQLHVSYYLHVFPNSLLSAASGLTFTDSEIQENTRKDF